MSPQNDRTTLIVGAGAVAMAGLGIYLWMRKPPGVSPGEKVIAHFKFDYLGDGGLYTIQMRLGYHRLANWFDPEEGLLWYYDINLVEPDTYEFDLACLIPDGTPARTYDAEASIRTPDMPPEDRLIRVFKDKAVTVRKE